MVEVAACLGQTTRPFLLDLVAVKDGRPCFNRLEGSIGAVVTLDAIHHDALKLSFNAA